MGKVVLQSAVLLILGQLILGAVGLAVPPGLAWLGLLLGALIFWLIVRIARVLRSEMTAALEQQEEVVVPWQVATWATMLWQWPSILLLWPDTVFPEWMGRLWNGVALPVQGTVDLFADGAAIQPWLWVAVAVEAVTFWILVARPLPAQVAARKQAAEAVQRTAAGTNDWAPARRHKDVQRRNRRTKR